MYLFIVFAIFIFVLFQKNCTNYDIISVYFNIVLSSKGIKTVLFELSSTVCFYSIHFVSFLAFAFISGLLDM